MQSGAKLILAAANPSAIENPKSDCAKKQSVVASEKGFCAKKAEKLALAVRSEKCDKTAANLLASEIGGPESKQSAAKLVARVKAVLRRKIKREGKKITIGKILHIDLARYEVMVEGKKIPLTSTEFRLLHILAQRSGWVFSRNQILTALWGEDKIVIDRTIDVHINHLREKLGKAGAFIKNVRGIGYKLEA